jgi:arylsulfatase A-like enzyme
MVEMSRISRREFLQLAGLVSANLALPLYRKPVQPALQTGATRNILIVVFDAWSAFNIPFYNYARDTTPNLTRFLDRAIVYHQHYATSNFTTPGTTSLLTGTYPWTHGAILLDGVPRGDFRSQNLFDLFSSHHGIVYSHNLLVNTLFRFFEDSLDTYIPRQQLFVGGQSFFNQLVQHDEDIALLSLLRYAKQASFNSNYSLVFPRLYEFLQRQQVKQIEADFPGGIPAINNDEYFILSDGIQWLIDHAAGFPQPFMGYFHFLPPHAPYSTHKDLVGRFDGDGYRYVDKPAHPLSWSRDAGRELDFRQTYDEYILYVDQEFARLFEFLSSSGLAEDTLVVLTSDHGELFERGVVEHRSPFLTDPVIRIPLVIFDPQRSSREDVHSPTSAVDLLPTLLHMNEIDIPHWVEGKTLPPYGPADTDRALYAFYGSLEGNSKVLKSSTATAIQDQQKYIHYRGYEELNGIHLEEFFDLGSDPFELEDLGGGHGNTARSLRDRLFEQLTGYYSLD